jgi:hypothetical protein
MDVLLQLKVKGKTLVAFSPQAPDERSALDRINPRFARVCNGQNIEIPWYKEARNLF